MKSSLYSVFVVASLLVAVAHCYPGAPRQSEDTSEETGEGVDTVLVLPGSRNPFAIPRPLYTLGDLESNEDDGLGFNPFRFNFNPMRSNPLDGFVESMQNVMNRIKEQIQDRMAGVLSSLPGQGAFGPWGKMPEGNTTSSTTKIIDGHIVTVNDTTYESGDDNGHAVFRVRIVDVVPLNQTLDGSDATETDVGGGEEIETVTTGTAETSNKEETTTPARSVETVEDFNGNVIPKNDVDTLTA